MAIDKYFKGTAEQLNEVLTNGSAVFTDKDGYSHTITREEIENGSVVIDTGRADIAEFMNFVRADMHRLYGFNHTPFVVESLKSYYNDILSENAELADSTAVGYTLMLRDGEKVLIDPEVYGGKAFINGVERNTDYYFAGENSSNGCEIVQVWNFAAGAAFFSVIQEIRPTELIVINKTGNADIDSAMSEYAEKLTYDEYYDAVKGYTNRELTMRCNNLAAAPATSNTEIFTYTGINLRKNFQGISGNTNIKKINLPNLEILFGRHYGDDDYTDVTGRGFFGAGNPELAIQMPKLKQINGSNLGSTAVFRGMNTVVIPKTCKRITRIICYDNKKIILECSDDAEISSAWCSTTPTELFEMRGEEWGTAMNITTSAANWTDQQYLELFHRLKNYNDGVTAIHDLKVNANGMRVATEYNTDIPGFGEMTWADYLYSERNWGIIQ